MRFPLTHRRTDSDSTPFSLFDKQLKNHARAEETYKWILEVDEDDEVAQNGHEEALQAQDKIEDLIELLLERGQEAESHSVRARSLNKIGHIYATVLDDPEQACFAFAQALAQDVQNDEFAADLERAAGKEMTYWADAMRTLHEVTEHPSLDQILDADAWARGFAVGSVG